MSHQFSSRGCPGLLIWLENVITILMTSEEIHQRFLKFFADVGHKVVPSSSLIPEGDSSVLFTTAGMQQFKPYYIGVKSADTEFGSLNAVSVQKCIRTSDIDEVGDERHLTFFEMLGNFSFGGYWKREAIQYAYDFVTKEMDLKIDYVTVFEGVGEVPADTESEKIWKSIDPGLTIKKFGREDNFWGPTGEEGPCGPTTEIYVDGIEIWNIVFNEFYQNRDKTLRPLETKGIDTGMGLERLAKVVQKVPTVFETDLLADLIAKVPFGSEKDKRIISDHMRAAAFLLDEGVRPSNKDQGYILRRLLRRVWVIENKLKLSPQILEDVIIAIIEKYKKYYPSLAENKKEIINAYFTEWEKFKEALSQGMKEFQTNPDPFILFTTYGFPLELIKELAKEKGVEIDEEAFQQKFKEHQEISRAGSEQKFKGGLAGHSEMEIKYHTATHLLHQALRDVLGNHVQQKGSNITTERLRFDFSHLQKMTQEEIEKVEEIVNDKIKEDLPVNKIMMSKEEAERSEALHFFGDKYGDEVNVYFIGPSLAEAYSKEFCGGPHVERTGELGHFKISKEEAVAQGVRRIKAVLK